MKKLQTYKQGPDIYLGVPLRICFYWTPTKKSYLGEKEMTWEFDGNKDFKKLTVLQSEKAYSFNFTSGNIHIIKLTYTQIACAHLVTIRSLNVV